MCEKSVMDDEDALMALLGAQAAPDLGIQDEIEEEKGMQEDADDLWLGPGWLDFDQEYEYDIMELGSADGLQIEH